MPDLSEHDLHKLFHAAGHTAPTHDLSDRIMAQVAVTRILRPTPVQPLIGTRGCLLIAAGLAGVIGYSLTGSSQSAPDWSGWITERLAHIRLPKGEWTMWLAAGAGLALLFTVLDTTLRSRLRGSGR